MTAWTGDQEDSEWSKLSSFSLELFTASSRTVSVHCGPDAFLGHGVFEESEPDYCLPCIQLFHPLRAPRSDHALMTKWNSQADTIHPPHQGKETRRKEKEKRKHVQQHPSWQVCRGVPPFHPISLFDVTQHRSRPDILHHICRRIHSWAKGSVGRNNI